MSNDSQIGNIHLSFRRFPSIFFPFLSYDKLYSTSYSSIVLFGRSIQSTFNTFSRLSSLRFLPNSFQVELDVLPSIRHTEQSNLPVERQARRGSNSTRLATERAGVSILSNLSCTERRSCSTINTKGIRREDTSFTQHDSRDLV